MERESTTPLMYSSRTTRRLTRGESYVLSRNCIRARRAERGDFNPVVSLLEDTERESFRSVCVCVGRCGL